MHSTGSHGDAFEFVSVPPENEGQRLEWFVRTLLPGLSRRAVRQAIEEGRVWLNGRPASKGDRLQAGDVVGIGLELAQARELQPNADLPVRVLFEDAWLVAVDKPAGIPSHALRPYERATVANFLLAVYPEMRALSPAGLEAGLVHRLDRDTSGVLLAARTEQARQALRHQFAAREIRKEYVALVQGGVAEPGVVRNRLEHDPHQPGKVRPASAGRGREALTYYHPVERYSDYTLLRVTIYTGVLHQVRAHLALIGHPVVGDTLYGGAADSLGLQRQFLHAARVALRHPHTGETLTVEAPLPKDLALVLERLRGQERELYRAARPRRRAPVQRGGKA